MFNVFTFRRAIGGNAGHFYDTMHERIVYADKIDENERGHCDGKTPRYIQFCRLDAGRLAKEFIDQEGLPYPDGEPPDPGKLEDLCWDLSRDLVWEWFFYRDSRFIVETIKWCAENGVEFRYRMGDYNGKGDRWFLPKYEGYICSSLKELLKEYQITAPERARFLQRCIVPESEDPREVYGLPGA